MAECVEVWKAMDGTFWRTESQALAYECKMYLINLGRSASAIAVSDDGLIDEEGLRTLVSFAASALNEKAAKLKGQ